LAEKFGVTNPSRALAFDEIWSDGRVHKRSSRFWPQCERIKAAVVLGEGKIADIAMQALIENFLMLKEGLWKDTLLESGEYGDQPVKASSLYHIINAISEYAEHRPKIAL
jgi:mannose/cellobiose epimerase-like protein (N-acyl-D-glucosamine 2-epimerase family)